MDEGNIYLLTAEFRQRACEFLEFYSAFVVQSFKFGKLFGKVFRSFSRCRYHDIKRVARLIVLLSIEELQGKCVVSDVDLRCNQPVFLP